MGREAELNYYIVWKNGVLSCTWKGKGRKNPARNEISGNEHSTLYFMSCPVKTVINIMKDWAPSFCLEFNYKKLKQMDYWS